MCVREKKRSGTGERGEARRIIEINIIYIQSAGGQGTSNTKQEAISTSIFRILPPVARAPPRSSNLSGPGRGAREKCTCAKRFVPISYFCPSRPRARERSFDNEKARLDMRATRANIIRPAYNEISRARVCGKRRKRSRAL